MQTQLFLLFNLIFLKLRSKELIIKTLDSIEENLSISKHKPSTEVILKKQSEFLEEPTYARMISKEDYKINWNNKCK